MCDLGLGTLLSWSRQSQGSHRGRGRSYPDPDTLHRARETRRPIVPIGESGDDRQGRRTSYGRLLLALRRWVVETVCDGRHLVSVALLEGAPKRSALQSDPETHRRELSLVRTTLLFSMSTSLKGTLGCIPKG